MPRAVRRASHRAHGFSRWPARKILSLERMKLDVVRETTMQERARQVRCRTRVEV